MMFLQYMWRNAPLIVL